MVLQVLNTIDIQILKMMDNSIPDTVVCILCHGVIPRSRFKEHMRYEHGAFFDLDFLLASCLMDEDTKESWAKTVRPLEYEELEREETLKENTNYDKDDQTSASVVSEEVESSLAKATEPPLKKRGRKKKAKVPASDISNPKPEKEEVESSYSDVESMDVNTSGNHEENTEEKTVEGERFVCQVHGGCILLFRGLDN